MLLIGIDEAGYGPALGPLCHGYCALRCPADGDCAPPDPWKLLHPAVTRHPAPADGIAVDDSKKIFSSAHGRERLERAVRAFLPENNQSVHDSLLPESDRLRLAEDPWHACLCGTEHAPDASLPAPPLGRSGLELLAFGARALSARYFNQALSAHGENKADVSWSVICGQLTRVLKLAAPGESVHAVIDRQGGRRFYGPRLSALFPDGFVRTESETARESVYRAETGGRIVRVVFAVEADAQSFPVALSSMAAKLAREICMDRFNACFRQHAPHLKPTAGYPEDARRFLNETRALRLKLGIADEVLIRRK